MRKRLIPLFLALCVLMGTSPLSVAQDTQSRPPVSRGTETLPSERKVSEPFVAAAMQFNPILYNLEDNVQALYEDSKALFAQGVKLLCAPEMCTDRKSVV